MKKQSVQLNTDEIRLQSLNKSKTEKVLQKWASDEGEIQEEDIRKAASNYARLEINNRILKWIIVVVIVFLFVLLGFMIASVVIGVNITKDITVKNGALVSNSKNNPIIKTSNMKYTSKITLNSPVEVVDSLKTVTMTVNEGLYSAVVQFDVVSYVFIPGKKLTFYGHTHMADVSADGTVSYELLIPYDGAKRDDSSTSNQANSLTGTHTSTSNPSPTISISSCEDFIILQSQPNGQFKVTKDLTCTLASSTTTFTGTLDGQRHTLNLVASAPLFQTFQGTLLNYFINGTVQSSGNAGVVSQVVLGGAQVLGSGVYATLNVGSSQDTYAGLFFGAAQPSSNPISIYRSVSQGIIVGGNIKASGFVGVEQSSTSIIDYKYNAFATLFETTGNTTYFSFLNSNQPDCQKTQNNFCVVNNVSLFTSNNPCCFYMPYNITSPNYFFTNVNENVVPMVVSSCN